MFSNKGKRKFQKKKANVKGYLGGAFQGLTADADESHHSENSNEDNYYQDSNSNNNNNNNLPHRDARSCSALGSIQPQVSVLVEIPEELDIADSGRGVSPLKDDDDDDDEPNRAVPKRDSSHKDDSAAVAEIGNNLDDLDNYMMSVFYSNDDLSVYTKATTDTAFSCSNSSSSTVSTRRRHRGAALNRRKDGFKNKNNNKDDIVLSNNNGSAWLESMKKSSMNIFVDGEEGWTPKLGWRMTDKKKEWDSKPQDDHWEKKDPMFDSIRKERLEI